MSLPSRAKFYKDGEEVFELFINIGWVYDESNIPRAVRESIEDHNR